MRVTGSVRRWQERLLHHNLGTEVSRFADRFRPKYRFLDEEDCELLEGFSEDSYSRPSSPIQPPFNLLRDHVNPLIIVLALSWIVGLYFAFPSPTTIPVFIGAAIGVTSWTLFSWFRIALLMFRSKQFSTSCFASWPVRCRIGLATCTFLVIYWISRGLIPPAELVPPLLSSHPGVPERYFIAANLYNNEAVFNDWSSQLLKLSRHLGEKNTFISIYESNSYDNTKRLLEKFRNTLHTNGIENRIVTENADDRWWPYGTAPERIAYLAEARNRALKPLQSDDATIRLEGYDKFDKVIFLNDILFSWQSIVRLLATRIDGGDVSSPTEYDLACAMDYSAHGLYDTWVARDVCGTPLRPFWPYVKDKRSVEHVKREVPFRVATCWNGAVVFPAEPYIYRNETRESVNLKRGWKMLDLPSYPGARISPPLDDPIKFRTSGIDACDHSESFLFSYDLHRLYNDPQRPPRIYMNPTVKVAYLPKWYRWQNTVLRIGVVKWYVEHWSRGVPLMFFGWIYEWASTRRDLCTWSALNTPEHCPLLPGPFERHWDQ